MSIIADTVNTVKTGSRHKHRFLTNATSCQYPGPADRTAVGGWIRDPRRLTRRRQMEDLVGSADFRVSGALSHLDTNATEQCKLSGIYHVIQRKPCHCCFISSICSLRKYHRFLLIVQIFWDPMSTFATVYAIDIDAEIWIGCKPFTTLHGELTSVVHTIMADHHTVSEREASPDTLRSGGVGEGHQVGRIVHYAAIA